jgi:hypothetical protein
MNRLIEKACQAVAAATPRSNIPKQHSVTSDLGKVLMSDSVPPFSEKIQPRLPCLHALIQCLDLVPKLQTESSEVRSEIARVRVPAIKLAVGRKGRPKNRSYRRRASTDRKMVCSLRVQVSAEALELRKEKDRIGVVYLNRRVAPPWSCASYREMRSAKLVEFGGALPEPL